MFVKICGITNESDALLAVAVGANAVGFIFAPSPRQVTAQVAGEIARRLPDEILTVGVFRDEATKRVVKMMRQADLKAVQLHGSETPAQVSEIRNAGINIVLKAVVAGSNDLENADRFKADAILVDGVKPGSGEVYDWGLTDNAPVGVRLIVAGGLNPTNVGDAIERIRPWGVDVGSGVEAEPGKKDPNLVRDFVVSAREAYGRLGSDHPHARADGDEPYNWQEDTAWR